MTCSCKVKPTKGVIDGIVYCPLHAAAPRMRDALEWGIIWLERYPFPSHDQELRDIAAENTKQIRALLAEIEGEEVTRNE